MQCPLSPPGTEGIKHHSQLHRFQNLHKTLEFKEKNATGWMAYGVGSREHVVPSRPILEELVEPLSGQKSRIERLPARRHHAHAVLQGDDQCEIDGEKDEERVRPCDAQGDRGSPAQKCGPGEPSSCRG